MARKNNIIETTTKVNHWGQTVTTKKIKDELFRNSMDISESQSDLAKKETNDCVVRAFMFALNLSYEKAHSFVADKFKRKNRKGTYTSLFLKNVLGTQKNGYKITLMGYHPKYRPSLEKKLVNPKYKKETGYTVKSFMEQHPQGRYFLIVRGHALALVDGVLYGNGNEQFHGFRRPVKFALSCK
jgi:hypothetical protein